MDSKRIESEMARRLGRDRADVAKLLDALSVVLRDRIVARDNVAIPGFGTFEPQQQPEYVAVDPDTGRHSIQPPHVDVTFTGATLLRTRLANPN